MGESRIAPPICLLSLPQSISSHSFQAKYSLRCMRNYDMRRDVICGGGDGVVRKVRGRDLEWQVVQQVELDGAVLSLSLVKNQLEMIAACSSGSIYRISCQQLFEILSSSGHTTAVTCLSFGSAVGHFATGTISGELRVWEIGDYACVSVTKVPKAGAVKCVKLTDPGGRSVLISGWEDGSIFCHGLPELNRNQQWVISGAHRGGTLALDTHSVSLEYLVSGGQDGAVRVWRLATREMVVQFGEHARPVHSVRADVEQAHLVHSIGADGSVYSFDIKQQRRVVGHCIGKGSQLLSLTQRLDSERELVTGDSGGKLLFWDCDVREPVMTLQDPSQASILCCAVSPSGAFLAYGGSDTILKVLNLQTYEILTVGVGHSEAITTVSWTPDEKQIVSGGSDCCVCVWNFFLGG